MSSKFSSRVWLFLILLAAFAYRIYRLGASSLWYDETVSLFLARQDLSSLTRHTAGDIHPPLYYYLLHFWGQVAGWSEFSAAFLSLFFGVLLVALVYRVAHEWLNPRVAFVAGFLVAASPYNLWYSQEVRMYTLGATLGLASVYFFVRLFQARGDVPNLTFRVSGFRVSIPRDWTAYVVVSAAGMYTLYYFAFLIAFEDLVALVWLAQSKMRAGAFNLRFTLHALLPWILSQLGILLLYLPWLPIAFRQATDPPVPPWRSFTLLPNVLLESFSALALGQSIDPKIAWPILLIVAVVMISVLVQDAIKKREGVRRNGVTPIFLLSYTAIPLAIIYVLSVWKPLYHVRYVFTYSPAFYILLAVGIVRVYDSSFAIYARQTAGRIISLVLLLLFLLASAYSAYNFWFDPQYADDDLRGAVKQISELWRPGDAVLIDAGYTYTAFVYYFDQPIAWRGRLTSYPPTGASVGTLQRLIDQQAGAIVVGTGSIDGGTSLGWGNPESDFYATTAEETRTALDRIFAEHPRVWMLRLYDTVVDPNGVIRDYLAQHGRLIHDQVFNGESNARVQGYLTSQKPLGTLPASATPRQILLGNRITLLGFEPATLSVHPGAPIDVNLYWRAKEATNADLRVFIGLFTEDGKLMASTSELPLGNGLGTSRWVSDEVMREPARLIAPKNIPPGNYALRIAMYNPFTNEPLEAEKNEWVREAGQIRIANVRIE